MLNSLSKSARQIGLVFLVGILFSATVFAGEEANNALQCNIKTVKTDKTKLWICEDLISLKDADVAVKGKLVDIDFNSGDYRCDYDYTNGGRGVIACNYKSSSYALKKDTIKKFILGTRAYTENNGSTAIPRRKGTIETFTPLVFDTTFNTYNVLQTGTDANSANIMKAVQTSVNSTIATLKAMKEGKDNKLLLESVNKNLKDLNILTFSHLIQPYEEGLESTSSTGVDKSSNFSLFLAGLVTLDPDVVKGYNADTGKLVINETWRLKATAVGSETLDANVKAVGTVEQIGSTAVNAWDELVSWTWFGNGEHDFTTTQALISNPIRLHISSWLDVFEMKLWGFYYHLQKRFDLAYDLLSTQLLFIMLLWFMMSTGTKGGVSFLLNRDQSFQMTEGSWMKTLTTLLAVGVFYVSLPTPVPTGEANNPVSYVKGEKPKNEMQKNRTIAKFLIRYSAKKGAEFGTMMSDLGLDAFLNFVIKKQNMFSGDNITTQFGSELLNLSNYYDALSIVKSCRSSYNKADADFYNSIDSNLFTVDEKFIKQDAFFVNNKISSISYSLCKKAYVIVATVPRDSNMNVETTKARITDIDAVMGKAVNFMVRNQIVMQDRMGWVNTFSVPITYFIMKHNNMFLSPGIDMDAIEEKVADSSKAMGLKSSEDISLFSKGDEAISKTRAVQAQASKISGAVQKGLASLTSFGTSSMMYNILPGFTSIREGVHSYLSDIYGDLIKAKKSKKGSGYIVKKLRGTIIKAVMVVPGFGTVVTMIMAIIPDLHSYFTWRTIILVLSFVIAIAVWKTSFITMFLSTIAMMILLKTVLYFKDLLIHTMVSPFLVLWAFVGTQNNNGANKMMNFVRDTLVLMVYPMLIVLSTYTFIFVYELFSLLYTFLMTSMIEGQKATISLLTTANSTVETFSAYFSLAMLGYMSELLVDVFGFILAVLVIMKLPEFILKKMGLGDSEAMGISNSAEQISSKGERHASQSAFN